MLWGFLCLLPLYKFYDHYVKRAATDLLCCLQSWCCFIPGYYFVCCFDLLMYKQLSYHTYLFLDELYQFLYFIITFNTFLHVFQLSIVLFLFYFLTQALLWFSLFISFSLFHIISPLHLFSYFLYIQYIVVILLFMTTVV